MKFENSHNSLINFNNFKRPNATLLSVYRKEEYLINITVTWTAIQILCNITSNIIFFTGFYLQIAIRCQQAAWRISSKC